MACVALQTGELRPKLQEMAGDPDPYPFLSVVEDYLASSPDDDPLRAAAMGALVKKGLFTVAVELGKACPARNLEGRELRAAAAQLARAPSEIRDWSTTDARFAANLRALSGRGAEAQALAAELQQVSAQDVADFTLHEANDGSFLVRGTRSDGRRMWIPAALDYAGKIEALGDTESFEGRVLAPFLFDGVGMGWLLPRLHAATQCTYLDYSPALLVVETNLRALALVLRLHDWRVLLEDDRVYLFAGPSAWEGWRDFMQAHPSMPLPGGVHPTFRWPGQTPSPGRERLAEVAKYRDSVRAGLRRHADEVYAGRDAAFWADRYEHAGPDDPLRVLCLTTRYSTFLQHSMRDLMAAMQRAGLVTRLLIEEGDHAGIPPRVCVSAFIEFQPDLVVIIDHHRHERPGVFVPNVPFVCWIQDMLPWLFTAEAGRRLEPMDFTIGFGFTECVLRHGYPADRFMPCRLAIDPSKFAPDPDGGEPDPALRCDVAYVSHHSDPPEVLHAREREQATDDQIRRLMDAFYEETRPLFASVGFNAGYDLDRLLRNAELQVGFRVADPGARTRLMTRYVRPLADRALRHATLAWVADWADAAGRKVHLYGRGWEAHPRFARYARGPAEHGCHLGQIARAAAINLHTGMNGALHQRVLETACGGGFVMVRYHPHDFYDSSTTSFYAFLRQHRIDHPTRLSLDAFPADYVEMRRRMAAVTGREPPTTVDITDEILLDMQLGQHLDQRHRYANLAFPDLDRITFDGPEAFARRAEHYLEHPDERRAIARRMQDTVHELFTYDALVHRMVAFVSGVLRAEADGGAGPPE